MPAAQFTVQSVTPLKSGVKDGREWTMLKVVPVTPLDSGVASFITFNGEWVKKVGQTVQVEYESKPSADGKYVNHRILDPKPQRRGKGGFPIGPVMDKLASIEGKLDMVLDVLKVRVP